MESRRSDTTEQRRKRTAAEGEVGGRGRAPAVFVLLAALSLVAGMTACGDVLEPAEQGTALVFQSPGGVSASVADAAVRAARTVEGTNGALQLEAMHAVMGEFELEREESGDCDDDAAECEDFEAGPLLLEIPMEEGAAVTAFRSEVPAGNYEELEFEVEAPNEDDGAGLLGEIREDFPHWPEDASVRITGTFTTEDGEESEFLVFLDAEVEIELEFEPFLTITEDGGESVTVTVDPSLWFRHADGSVTDLTAYHCDPPTVCPIPELEVEFEREGGEAFTEIEWDD